MADYEITGLQMPTCAAAVARFSQMVAALAAPGTEGFSVEAHFSTFQAMNILAEVLPSERYALYGWRTIPFPIEFRRPEFTSLGKARMVFAKHVVTADTRPTPPAYDWDGKATPSSTIWYIEEKNIYVKEMVAQYHIQATAKSIAATLREIVSCEPNVRTSTSSSDGMRDYIYIVDVPLQKLPVALEALCSFGKLKRGVGSFEFLGRASEIEALAGRGEYSLTDFPRNSWSFNASVGRTPLALESASFLYPVLNVCKEQMGTAASVLEQLSNQVTRCSITRKYLSWKLGEAKFSPRVQGNYIMVSRQKSGYAMFVGFEQYADEDPPVKQYVSTITPVVKQFGGTLKAVPFIR